MGLFPISLNSTRVSYQGSTVLKASVAFSYDRYICGESTSLIRDLLNAFNNIFGRGNTYDPLNSGLSSISPDELNQLYGSQGAFMNNPPNAAGQSLSGVGNVIS